MCYGVNPKQISQADITFNTSQLSGNLPNNSQILMYSSGDADVALSYVNPCPAGFYCPEGIDTVPCSEGTYNPTTGSSSVEACLPCVEGYYCAVGASIPTGKLIGIKRRMH